MAAKLMAFCAARADLHQIADLCRPHAGQPATAAKTDGHTVPEVFEAVYLLRSGRFDKIGRSNAVGRRERELAIQLPERAQVVHEIRPTIPPASKPTGMAASRRSGRTANGSD